MALNQHIPLTEYLAAKARYAEADRLFNRALRTFTKLGDRIGDDERAYVVAGVGLADERMLAASRAMRKARGRLRRYVLNLTLPGVILDVANAAGDAWWAVADDLVERTMIIGAVMCADLPVPANDPRRATRSRRPDRL